MSIGLCGKNIDGDGLRILVVSQYFWPENFRINDLVRSLAERGHQITVLTGIPNYPEGRYYEGYSLFSQRKQHFHGAQVLRVPLFPRLNGRALSLFLNYISFAFFGSIVSPLLLRGGFDIIFVCQLSPVTVGLPAIVLKKLFKAPILFWVLDLWPESLSASGALNSRSFLAVMDKVVKYIYHNADKIVVSSRGFIQSIEAKGIRSEQLDYFPNWYEPEYLNSSSQSNAYLTRIELPVGFRVMFAGNIGAAQDFETILAAAEMLKKYRDIHWIILGDGRRFDWVKEQISLRALSDCFHLLGRFPSDAMSGFFSQADAMLVTLKRDPIFSLTVPGKIQSYMACGKPIIAALDGEGNRLVIESGGGVASPAEDASALAQSVVSLYNMSSKKREEMGECGKAYGEKNFNREVLMDRLEGWMSEVVDTV